MNRLYFRISQLAYFSKAKIHRLQMWMLTQAGMQMGKGFPSNTLQDQHWAFISRSDLDGCLQVSLTKFPVIHQFSPIAAHQFSTHLVTTAVWKNKDHTITQGSYSITIKAEKKPLFEKKYIQCPPAMRCELESVERLLLLFWLLAFLLFFKQS